MESIGQNLKAARERRQISIADVVAATKMSSTFVKALEADNYDALVAPVYARGFIKLYAACVGLDPMPLLKQFDVSSRAVPVLVPLPSCKTSSASLAKLAPKTGRETGDNRSPAISPAVLATAPVPISSRPPSWLASLRAGRLSALNQLFSVRVRWSQFKLPDRMFPCCSLPGMAWRRIIIVLFVILLIIAASLVWEYSHRGSSSDTDACRWVAEPPAAYLDMEVRAPMPGR